ncbi:MAG: molybdopterin dinucleotide binding domain-containing protein, partial [Actinomycetota bacterium]
NNSWMHNLPSLRGGSNRCTVQMHENDAARLGIEDGKIVRVESSSGVVELPAEVCDAVMPGVISIPHGWGHGVDGVGWSVAAGDGGTNSNVLAPSDLIDELSGNAVLNGIPVTVGPA